MRREEVATLAGVGLTWYTWLEQGRVTASDQVLDAVARVLGIDEVGREHLRGLARDDDDPTPLAPDALRPLLASWTDDPAALLDARLDVVETNTAWADIIGSAPGRHVLEGLVRRRGRSDDEVDALVRALARRLRMASDRAPTDDRIAGIRATLALASPERAPVWACRGVGAFGRPRLRVEGVDREAFLLGEAGSWDAETSVLVLLPSAVAHPG